MTSPLIDYRLHGKRALVTGGASGIGLATVELLARSGAAVAVNDLPGERLDRAVAQLRSAGATAIAAAGDVGDPRQATELMQRAIADLGGLDYLVNNAGTPATRNQLGALPCVSIASHAPEGRSERETTREPPPGFAGNGSPLPARARCRSDSASAGAPSTFAAETTQTVTAQPVWWEPSDASVIGMVRRPGGAL